MLSERNQSQRYTLYDSIFVTFSKRQDCSDGEQISACQGSGEGECVSVKEQPGGVFWGVMELFCVPVWWWPRESLHVSVLTELCTTNRLGGLCDHLQIIPEEQAVPELYGH